MCKWFYYVRISSSTGNKKQKTDRQICNSTFKEFCKRNNIDEKNIIILEEKQSGKDFNRPQYQLLKQVIRENDNIIINSIDRFGRNYTQGRKEFADLISKGVKVYVLNRPMLEDMYKLNDNMSKFMINFLVDWELMNAEEELKKIHERQRQGIEVAKAKGKHLGRPKAKYPDNWNEIYNRWHNGEIKAVEAMELLELKKSTFYKLAKKHKEKDI
ncbi:recombinase family protein [Clostridium tetani]|uniref:recombinase family protein n=1 Tax=Clostridium tetani TaxID=1513 RepID=UPI00100BB721|nr:recombinase family protein [Clostridium tetani]RXI50216.1 recombinase family protein [Clostridium tetani]